MIGSLWCVTEPPLMGPPSGTWICKGFIERLSADIQLVNEDLVSEVTNSSRVNQCWNSGDTFWMPCLYINRKYLRWLTTEETHHRGLSKGFVLPFFCSIALSLACLICTYSNLRLDSPIWVNLFSYAAAGQGKSSSWWGNSETWPSRDMVSMQAQW